jgi:hypothetical protein
MPSRPMSQSDGLDAVVLELLGEIDDIVAGHLRQPRGDLASRASSPTMMCPGRHSRHRAGNRASTAAVPMITQVIPSSR